jgi:hypothetical protein
MRFYSKKDWWLSLLIWFPMGFAFLSVWTGSTVWPRVLISVLVLFIGWIWLATYYEVREDVLIVRCGPMSERISINVITHIKKTRNPLSSTALSIDRLELRYGRSGYVLISPKDQGEFVEMLKGINPNIDFVGFK